MQDKDKHQHLRDLSDHDLLIRMVVTQENMQVEMTGIKEQATIRNGDVRDIRKDQYRMAGAIAMLAFLMVVGVPVLIQIIN